MSSGVPWAATAEPFCGSGVGVAAGAGVGSDGSPGAEPSGPDELIRTVKLLEPTFGGINLEDIRAPECFEIERRLKAAMSIPVFHDDQHGTAIISGAALLNALELAGKRIERRPHRLLRRRRGGARLRCASSCSSASRQENIVLCDEAA